MGKVVTGVNDLKTSHPLLTAQWHPTKNPLIQSNNITSGSHKKVWWVCEENHEWEATVYSRVAGRNCPYCYGQKPVPGETDLKTCNPKLATEWHPTKNGISRPEHFSNSSNQKVWWLGACGHEWETKISARSQKKGNCPYCLNACKTLLTVHPNIYSSLHPTKNSRIATELLTVGSKYKVWWLCKENHEWEAAVYSRVAGRNCPYCSNSKVLKGFNDLATTHPKIAEQWHPTKNGQLTPNCVVAGSEKTIWWICALQHEWQTTITSRTPNQNKKTTGCPYCANKKVLPGFNDALTTHPHLASEWSGKNNVNLNEITGKSGSRGIWVCEKGHEWVTKIADRSIYQTNCPTCSASVYASKGEKSILAFVKEIGFTVENNVRINGFELDIYVPEKQIAIEFNGVYWHSEAAGKTKNYHYNKWLACKNQGIQLIQIWEDDWNRNPDLIKRILSERLGYSTQEPAQADMLRIVSPLLRQTNNFLEKNYLQPVVSDRNICVGLIDENKNLLAVMCFIPLQNNILKLICYATSQPVMGGFASLLKYVERKHSPDSIVAYSDNCLNDSSLYIHNGFKEAQILMPDYAYLVKGKRVHKINQDLLINKDLLLEQQEDPATKKKLTGVNTIPRVWDAGETKWVKNLN